MDLTPRLVVLLPCFNEEQALPLLLRQLEEQKAILAPDWDLSVIVVDDGSSDNTAGIAESFSCGQLEDITREAHGQVRCLFVEIVRHATNQGLGAATSTGLRSFLDCTANEPEAVLGLMDADATHPPALLGTMLAKLQAEQLDVVIASRFAPGGGEHGLSVVRKLYSRLAGLAMRILAPIEGVQDYSCGYRVYRRSAIARAIAKFGDPLVTERGFVCMVELLVKLARSGTRMGEVGLDLHYELKQGASKMDVAATIRRYAAFALRARFDKSLR
ncbi:MAG: glycosyltransferase [bacterium]|nr:glycosyltransferase [bacterium]